MRKTLEYVGKSTRGRPKGHQPRSVTNVLNSIVQIATRQNLDPELLFDAFEEARLCKESECGKLKIKCRGIDQESAIFLITCNDEVVGQFSIEEEILRNPELLKPYIRTVLPRIIRRDHSKPKYISELKVAMKGVNLKARIAEIPPKRLINTRNGWAAYVSNVLLADKTGTIRLSLWNGQIDDFSVGDMINIEKASVFKLYDELHLKIGRNGKISVDNSVKR